MIFLVNQHTVPVFTDVVNAFAAVGPTTLFTGHIEPGRVPVSPSVRIRRSTSYNRTSPLTRIASWLTFTTHYFVHLCVCKKPAAIVAVTNPPLVPLVTSLVCYLRNIPFFIVVYDLYPEALKQVGLLSSENVIYRWWQQSNTRAFARAKKLVTLSESMREALTAYAAPESVLVIPNWADTTYVRPVSRSENVFATRHQLGDRLVVLYSGNMGLTHDLESLVDAAEILSVDNRFLFILIGDGGKRAKLESMAEEKRLSNILFLPFQDAATFPLAMAAGDIGIVTLGTGAEGISVPSKTYVNMAAGLAMIAISPPDSELARIVCEFEIGYTVSPARPHDLARLIESLAGDPHQLTMLKENARRAAMKFTPANAEGYVDLVRATLGQQRE